MGKKNLDKLFQEKFSNFSDVPDEKVWQSIGASLDKKKKSRKVIPIWWKFGGVAAVLAIALYLIDPFEDTNVINPTVTEIDTKEDKDNSKTEALKEKEVFEKSDTEIGDVDQQNSMEKEITSQEKTSNTAAENTKNNKEKVGAFKSSLDKAEIQIANDDTIDKKQKISNNGSAQPAIETNSMLKNDKEAVATVQDVTKTINSVERKTIGETDREDLAKQKNISKEKRYGIAQVEKNDSLAVGIDGAKKKSIFDEIADQEQEKEAIAENKGGKWSAGPSVAPVYFDAIGEGSPVHSIFVPNSKSGDLNLSYGLSVAYEISNKLKIRSGLHRVDYGYSTNGVEFSSSLESSAIGQIANVNYSATAKNIVVASNATESGLDTMVALIAQDFSGQGLSQNGTMAQQFGYLEVPVELEYALIDKKFGVNIIGGISSLFLVDNSISLSSGELTTEMGEANNVNDLNFSTNVGIGLNYKFTSKVQLNVEPVFKYQLNTFSQTDGTFQPFTIGVYSGISFKF